MLGMKDKPIRIQLKRTKGWKMPANTVRVARPSKWGNPFPINAARNVWQAVDEYRAYIDQHPELKENIRRELGGKNLACWCKASPCHADVLLEIANA